MKLTQIKICNFGIYESENVVPLYSNNMNNLTLIIGKNGAGKTTMLNAIKTAFYGPLLFKVKSITLEYKEFISEFLNKNALKQGLNNFYVELAFISNVLGADGHYTILRSWSLIDYKLTESLVITKNDTRLDDTSVNDFLSALYQAYPVELFDLFFFDGEKVDELSVLNQNIVEVLETAFNLTLYKSLKEDLEKYAINKSRNSALNQLELYKASLKEQISNLKLIEDSLNHKLSNYEKELNSEKRIITELAKQNIRDITEYDDGQLKQLQKELDDLYREVKRYVTDLIPYSSLMSQMELLLHQLKVENNSTKFEVVHKEISRLSSKSIQSKLINDDSLTQDAIEKILNVIKLQFSEKTNITKIHDISADQYKDIKNIVNELRIFNFNNYLQLKRNIENKRKEIERVRSKLIEAQSSEYKEHLAILLNSQARITSLEISQQDDSENLTKINDKITNLQNEYQKNELEIWRSIKTSNVDQLIIKTNTVLERYIETIKQQKIDSIKDMTLTMFNKIIRKEHFIKEIHLNENSIDFIDYSNTKLKHQHLSAGERQIFTFSLLVSVLNETERVTPMVFDTLLGRLDHDHRYKLLEELFNHTTSQVIILATDSEIDSELLTFVKPWINTTLSLDLSKNENKIIVER